MKKLILSFAVPLILLSGCAVPIIVGAGLGAGTVVYIKGWLEETISHPVPATYQATLSALKDMRLLIIEKRGDMATANIKAIFSDDKPVWIEMEAVGTDACTLKIRVGTFGDEQRSRMILSEIRKRSSNKHE